MIRLKALLVKEFLQMKRDKAVIAMMLFLPVVQLLLFGFAINTDVKHLPTIVYDQCLQQDSRDLLDSFTASGYFDIKDIAGNFEEVDEAVDAGREKVGIIIPPDFASNIKHGRSAEVQVIVDASDSMTASSAINAAQIIGQLKSQELMGKKYRQLTGEKYITPYDIRIRPWYNSDFVTAYYMVPGILGIVLTMTMVMITSMAIVRERETGTLEQLLVTPMKSYELMLGKIIPYIFVGYIQAAVALSAGILVFDLPVRGSLSLLFLLTTPFIVASLALGILISTIAKTQMQAMQMSFFVLLPSVLLSGFMFPREAMPTLFYYLGDILPATFYMEIMRGIILKGIGIQYLWTQAAALGVFIIGVFTISLVKFSKKIT
ncbi:ABC transporter permease [Megasphaera paucivorans]|uniref:ABC-2 type transport system permease protein n=1 Tax=Megasphaera paucivorans TaxID=349095 RepID=A0A1G9R276_9FIRM|nr:ABC transporter permease [Megasphaera paucivorans]SDM17402.1 ABC-2 type transport system permease protein [Megasphaera paucivorans]